ncbi:MAG TPA: DUF4091 domain-containing protein [Phycisphaerales bacterium]|nr:DUF4091 domain-containing protein [Phycisphaerales bacterium]
MTRTRRSLMLVSALTSWLGASAGEAQPIVWANNGQDKVVQGDLRAANAAGSVVSSVWDGSTVSIFGARNETVAFNLVLESPGSATSGVSVSFDTLTGPGGATIQSRAATPDDDLFNTVGRPIELFYVRYLQIKGIGKLVYESYDERHVPHRLRRPWSGEGVADPGTGWTDRPDHDAYYPDIAVPIELETPFSIAADTNQSIWVDVYIPKDSPAGMYSGTVLIQSDGNPDISVPVSLEVLPFTLPDEPALKTMLVLGYGDVNKRYVGVEYPYDPAIVEQMHQIRDKHFQMAHRHRISIVDGDSVPEQDSGPTHPSSEYPPRFDGSLFTPANGYDGPGVGVGNLIYAVALYGRWWYDDPNLTMQQMWSRTDGWASWFAANAPGVEYFLYIVDELEDPASLAKIEQWAGWIDANPGPGRAMKSFATMDYITGVTSTPSLDIPCATGYRATAAQVQAAADTLRNDPQRRTWWYNGNRPHLGTFATEDDGVALRAGAWGMFKKEIERWFMWESTYYNNFQGGTGETDVFNSAFTFGADDHFDPIDGRTGWNYSNGDGVLFYPGTDTVFPASSYGLNGPIASLRLKLWRRGIQDADYLALAGAIDPAATDAVVDATVPTILWEYGVTDPNDPTYVLTDISWSTDPDVWEAARRQLADIITGAGANCPADINGDGVLGPGDFTAWVAAYNANDPKADQNGDGQINPADFSAWIANFTAGCP